MSADWVILSGQVDFPIFLLAAVGDNLQRLDIEHDDKSNNAAYRSLLKFIMDDDLIREEVVDVIIGVWWGSECGRFVE